MNNQINNQPNLFGAQNSQNNHPFNNQPYYKFFTTLYNYIIIYAIIFLIYFILHFSVHS